MCVRACRRRVSVVEVRVFRACARGERLLGVINSIMVPRFPPLATCICVCRVVGAERFSEVINIISTPPVRLCLLLVLAQTQVGHMC